MPNSPRQQPARTPHLHGAGAPRRILVAVTLDGESDEAVAVAAAIASPLGAEIVLAGIAPPAPPAIPSGELTDLATPSQQVERQQLVDRLVGERLEEVAARLPAGLDSRTLLSWGSTGEALVEVAHDQRADLVVVPMRRGNELQHLVHDHADRHLLPHCCDVPVLVVPTPRQPARGDHNGWAA
jgi:nucleotide-binding universal stress UspA family protein